MSEPRYQHITGGAQGGAGYSTPGANPTPRTATGSDALLAKAESVLQIVNAVEARLGALANRAVGDAALLGQGGGGAAGGSGVAITGGFARELEIRLEALSSTLNRVGDHLSRLETFV